MEVYRIYVPRTQDVISDIDLVKQYKVNRSRNFFIRQAFTAEYDLRAGDLVTLNQDADEVVYKVKVVIVQSTQIALLAEEFREGSVFFNLARLEYGRQNYDQALRYLQQAYPKDLVNQLILKTIQLKIYYETEELDLLDSHLESFRPFIRRRAVSDYHRTTFSKVISFTRKLLSLPLGKNTQHQELIEAIKQEPILSERAWLLSKLNP